MKLKVSKYVTKLSLLVSLNQYKNKLIAERALDLANLLLISLSVNQIFSQSYRFGVSVVGFLASMGIYVMIYFIVKWENNHE